MTPELPQALARLAITDPARLTDWQHRSRAFSAPRPTELRAIHHFACTGGTVICKALATMPNLTLLTEIDPLSPMDLPVPGSGKPVGFHPRDLLYHARAALRPLPHDSLEAAFTAALDALLAGATRAGRFLCIRGHAHSQYCLDESAMARPTLRALLMQVAPLHDVVTVRHPLASYVALQTHGWVDFTPDHIDTYAARYMAFLNTHQGVPVLRYEDFTTAPEPFLHRLCQLLRLPYAPGAEAFLNVVRMSGDSGRKTDTIQPRPPRPVPEPLAQQARDSAGLRALCDRLGYAVEDAIPDTAPTGLTA